MLFLFGHIKYKIIISISYKITAFGMSLANIGLQAETNSTILQGVYSSLIEVTGHRSIITNHLKVNI